MTQHYLDILQRTILENWDQPALTDFYLTDDGTAQDTSRGNRYTYGEMYAEMMRLGSLFRSLGLKQGDHIAICGSNSANWAVAYLAIAAFQGVAVTVLHTQNIDDIAYQIDFSDSVCLFTDKELWEELVAKDSSPSLVAQQGISQSTKDRNPSLLPNIHHVIALDDFSILFGAEDYRDTIGIPKGYNKNDEPADTLNREITERRSREELMLQLQNSKLSNSKLSNGKSLDSLAMICFTSGSNNQSKGVMLSWRNLSNNAKNNIDGYPDDEITHFLSVLPMTHIYGLMTEIITQLLKGKHVYILTTITLYNLYQAISIVRPYALRLIPFMVSGLMRTHQDCISLLCSCKQIYIGGSLFDSQLEQTLLDAHAPISIGYGMTETGPLISYSICSEYKLGTCGKIVEGMQATISDSGEILVSGENVMLGYYKNPEATAQKIDADGWLHTGDSGYMDNDGYLYVTGRIGQDMIVLPNGENIHPEDIESKINALPEVAESIVIARDGKLVALVVENPEIPEVLENLDILENPEILEKPETPAKSEASRQSLSHHILRQINPLLPDYSQLYSVEFLDQPLARTAKQTIKRYLYK